MQNRRDMTASAILIFLGILVVVWSFKLEVGTLLVPLPGFFPFVVGASIIVLALILFIRGWQGKGEAPKAYGKWQKPVIMLVSLVVYALLLEPLGYVLANILIGAVTLLILGITSWKVIGLGSVALSLSSYYLFKYLLSVELPTGILTVLG